MYGDAPEHRAGQAAALAPAPPRYRQALFSGFAVAAAGHTFDTAGVIDLAAAHLADARRRSPTTKRVAMAAARSPTSSDGC